MVQLVLPIVKYIINTYNVISKYPTIIEVEEKGDYTKALELFTENEKDTVLQKVNRNYRLYKIAKSAGLEEEASKHKGFVLENGGDTIYKRELENE